MIYRMKQNAVGLANICVLSTVVLVMLSSTVSLYGESKRYCEAELSLMTSAALIRRADRWRPQKR